MHSCQPSDEAVEAVAENYWNRRWFDDKDMPRWAEAKRLGMPGVEDALDEAQASLTAALTLERKHWEEEVRARLLSGEARDAFLAEFKEWASPEEAYWEAMKALFFSAFPDTQEGER